MELNFSTLQSQEAEPIFVKILMGIGRGCNEKLCSQRLEKVNRFINSIFS